MAQNSLKWAFERRLVVENLTRAHSFVKKLIFTIDFLKLVAFNKASWRLETPPTDRDRNGGLIRTESGTKSRSK